MNLNLFGEPEDVDPNLGDAISRRTRAPAKPAVSSSEASPRPEPVLYAKAAPQPPRDLIPPHVRRALGRPHYRDVAKQVDLEYLMTELAAPLRVADSVIHWIYIKGIAINELEARRWRNAQETLLDELLYFAAIEVVEPGLNETLAKYRLTDANKGPISGAADANMRLDQGGLPRIDDVDFLDGDFVERAIGLLAARGLPKEALEDMALVVGLPTFGEIRKAIIDYERERDRQRTQLEASLDRKGPPKAPPCIDGEFGYVD